MAIRIKSVDCIDCYACGLSVVDPVEDGYSYNLDPDDHSGRMFNETCIVFESYLLDYPQSMGKWIRSCPENVKSCFWAKGAYNGEGKSSFEFSELLKRFALVVFLAVESSHSGRFDLKTLIIHGPVQLRSILDKIINF